MSNWIDVCEADEIDEEDVVRFDHEGKSFAIYRSPEDTYHATDGHCTHEHVHLADGLVMNDIIECPNTTAASTTRRARQGAPVCVNLKTYPVKVEGGRVLIQVADMVTSGMVIVGAGEAGVRAAFALREQGYQGTISLIGMNPICLMSDRPCQSGSRGRHRAGNRCRGPVRRSRNLVPPGGSRFSH